MAQHRSDTAMDSPHITEFASERYFEKLHQLNASQQQHDDQTASFESPAASISASTPSFILPWRDSKNTELDAVKPSDQTRDKGRFFSLRHKVSILHVKAHTHNYEPFSTSQTSRADARLVRKRLVSSTYLAPFGASSDPKHFVFSPPFHDLFLALPNELQIQILSSLPLTDVLNLRQTAKMWHTLITLKESPIVRYHLDYHIPAYALRLYPLSNSADLTLHHLCSLWHRLHVAAKLAFLMSAWITKDIFLRQTDAQRAAFAPQHERMRRRLIPLLFTVFHFFETYRFLHLNQIVELNGHGLQHYPYTVNPIEREIMDMYDDQTLLRVHEIFPLFVSSFCRRLRPPTYVGRVERSLRGYLRERPSDEIQAAILCVGGLRQVERLWGTKGYNCRLTAVDSWFHGLKKGMTAESSTKMRLGLKGFGRKKSTSGERPALRLSGGEGSIRGKSTSAFVDTSNVDGPVDLDWVFNTSLAAGMPMAPLSKEHTQLLLGNLPILQQIWLTTAEAMILERGIVQRTQDIKRNQQVMLELIREHGMDDEDEWWYGRSIPESVRPPPGATDDDAD